MGVNGLAHSVQVMLHDKLWNEMFPHWLLCTAPTYYGFKRLPVCTTVLLLCSWDVNSKLFLLCWLMTNRWRHRLCLLIPRLITADYLYLFISVNDLLPWTVLSPSESIQTYITCASCVLVKPFSRFFQVFFLSCLTSASCEFYAPRIWNIIWTLIWEYCWAS